jgi:hypothetical protein
MKNAISIIVVLALIIALAFGMYEGWQVYKEWKEARNSQGESKELQLIELLNDNQEAIVKLYTKIATVEKRIAADTLKETTIIGEDAPTYNEIKDELIELRKDEEANKEEIDILRLEYEERIKEYRGSPDKIMINTGKEKIIIYEDDQGNLVSLESGVKITRHREAKEVIKELQAGMIIEKDADKDYKLAFGMIYDLDDKSFNPGLSYELLDWRKFSLNITGYDFENIKGGLDLCYNIGENIVVGAGINLIELKDFEINIDRYYLRAGIEIKF